MATLKRRLRRKNTSGEYDTIHLETSASCVLMANGTTVENAVNGKAAASHVHGTLTIQGNGTNIAGYNGGAITANITPGNIGAAAASHTHNLGDLNGVLPVAKGGTGITAHTAGNVLVGNGSNAVTSWTVAVLKSKLGIGVGPGASFNINSIGVGTYVKWGNWTWIIVHSESDRIYLAMFPAYVATTFSSSAATATYPNSTLRTVAANFQNTIPADSLALAVDTTVNGVTAKIFVPSYEQVNGGFMYFHNNGNRICTVGSVTDSWWTSTIGSNNISPYYIDSNGAIKNNRYDTSTITFRPFVALRI